MRRSRAGTAVPKILVAALLVAACSDAVSPERRRMGAPLFAFSANGISQSANANGALNEPGNFLAKGFDPKNPRHGDAVIATVFWIGSSSIDSLIDFIADGNDTRARNIYHRVDSVSAGGYTMVTYVATNIQNFPDSSSVSGQILAVRAYMHQAVVDGGIKISAWSGVEDDFAIALRDVAHASGIDTGANIPAHTRPIAVNAGGMVYTATMGALDSMGQAFTGLGAPGAPFGPMRCIGGPPCRGSDRYILEDAEYAVLASAGTVDPTWTWMYAPPARPWLVTTLSLNAATGGTGSGNLTVTTTTTGSNLDSDGYTATVDGATSQAIASNGSVTFSNLTAGSHSVVLSGVATNCTVSGGNTQTVNVPSGGTVTAAFSVSCGATTGNLTVTASTTGSNLDPDGYTATVDGSASKAVATNGSVTFTGLAAGSHSVVLSGVATNCTVSGGNTQTVNVPSGGTGTATFSVTCTALAGNLTVSASTTGSGLDPDGYTATVDGSTSKAVATNGSVTFTGLTAGSHTVVLSGVAANCTVSGGTSRTVTVPSGGTATVSYAVTCTTPNQAPVVNAGPDERVLTGLLFTETATFSDPDNGPWTYQIDWGDGSSTTGSMSSPGTISKGHTYITILPRTFTIRVTVTDSKGASGSDTKAVYVVLL
jgi:hypothetical protein